MRSQSKSIIYIVFSKVAPKKDDSHTKDDSRTKDDSHTQNIYIYICYLNMHKQTPFITFYTFFWGSNVK